MERVMRIVNGMHLSNTRHWYIEDQIAAARDSGAITLLHHLMFPRDDVADQWGDPENAYWFIKLRDGWEPQDIPPAPERLIHVRMFHSNWTQLLPELWAEHTVDLLSDVVCNTPDGDQRHYNLWDDPFVAISAANEQNLHYECGDLDPANQPLYRTTQHYERIARWNLVFWKRVDELVPDRKALACWSALAYGHDADTNDIPDSEYHIPAIREAIDAVDIGASHPYAHLNWEDGSATIDPERDGFYHMLRPFRPEGWRNERKPDKPLDRGGELSQFPGKPWLFTECGTFTHSHVDRTDETLTAMRRFLAEAAKSSRVLGCTWFIGNTDDAHTDNNIGSNERLRTSLAMLEDYRTVLSVPVRAPAPDVPESRSVRPALEVRVGDTWWGLTREILGHATVDRVTELRAANPDIAELKSGIWVVSPWHDVTGPAAGAAKSPDDVGQS
jgi:hypothetical protein